MTAVWLAVVADYTVRFVLPATSPKEAARP